MKKSKKELPKIETDIFQPITIKVIGWNMDPCFGKHYDLTTKECKRCGDSELCAIIFMKTMNITRNELEEKNPYKDLESTIDIRNIKKYMRGLKRKGDSKKDIITKTQSKFELSIKDTRNIYRLLNN